MGLQSKDECYCGNKYDYSDDKNESKKRFGGDKTKEKDISPQYPLIGRYNDNDSNKMCGGPHTNTCGKQSLGQTDKGGKTTNFPPGGCCGAGAQNGNTCDWTNAVWTVKQSKDDCKRYTLFDKIIDTKDSVNSPTKDRNKISLYDMCPHQCNSETKCPTN